MGNNGFQEPATDFKDGKIIGTKRLFTDGKFGGKDGKAKFMETQWRGLQAPVKLEGFKQNNKPEPGGACLVPEQFTFVGGKCPVLGEFFRLPILFHELIAKTPIVRRRSIPRTFWAYAASCPR
jgi:hypothetical protein